MHPQLQEIADDFHRASARLDALLARVPVERWNVRTAPDRWSVAECIEHLNLTAEAILPPLRTAIAAGQGNPAKPGQKFKRDLMGWLLWKVMPPPARLKAKTPPGFVPTARATREEIVARFEQFQREQLDLLSAADGLDLQALRVQSPFSKRASYNLYSAFSILPRHQHRHIWQAEQTLL